MASYTAVALSSIPTSEGDLPLRTLSGSIHALNFFPNAAPPLQQPRFRRPFRVASCLNTNASEEKRSRHRLRVPNAVQNKDEALVGSVIEEEQKLTPKRTDFPEDFLFGFSTSAFQWEGELLGGGRGSTIWDSFSHIPGKIADGTVPTVGCDGYNKYQEDIKKIKDTGANAYRISVSWSRLLPDGKNINPEGVAFYNRLINEIILQGLTPLVTLYHWDMPLILENDPNVLGWRTKNIVEYFALFADTCFKHFGDRVKLWITFNEIHSFTVYGYGYGIFAPGRCSEASGYSCPVGDSSTEPYLVTHNVLLSHAAAAKIYRRDYQKEQKGKVGITNISHWYEPYDSESPNDKAAAERCLEFQTAWFWDPLFFGDYPRSMRLAARDRLPKFTPEESESLIGSIDFLGINYYFANYARNAASVEPSMRWWATDTNATMSVYGPDGKPIGELFAETTPLSPVCPWGLQKILVWLSNRYGRALPIYITESGCADTGDGSAPLDDQNTRIKYVGEHLSYLARAINDDKCNVKGYMAWSLLDGWEWSGGYTVRFGFFNTDFEDENIKRVPKQSVAWFTNFLANKVPNS